jgi:hypothetical protein
MILPCIFWLRFYFKMKAHIDDILFLGDIQVVLGILSSCVIR